MAEDSPKTAKNGDFSLPELAPVKPPPKFKAGKPKRTPFEKLSKSFDDMVSRPLMFFIYSLGSAENSNLCPVQLVKANTFPTRNLIKADIQFLSFELK